MDYIRDPEMYWDDTYVIGWFDSAKNLEPDQGEIESEFGEAYLAGYEDQKESIR